ncbi:hypothetical protein ACIO3O_38955 [Streptomyces sp. NPDC087440]|uniref:hypothetical protein n=1 Tax=Streptomyces sp. NPDC087440 TaxID=3365790 RepID=UPI00381FD622
MAAESGHCAAYDRSTVSRWLSGTTPRPPAPTLLLEALSRRLARPVTSVEAGLSQAPSTLVDLSGEADPLHRLSHLTAAELDPTRRHILGTGIYSVAALAAPALWHPLLDPPHPPAPHPGMNRRAGPAELGQMHTMIHNFAQSSQAHGSAHLRTTLAAYLRHDVAGYLHRPAAPGIHEQLLSAAAQLTLLLGNICAGDGGDAHAQQYHLTAARLARDAGDAATYAITLRTMSAHAHDLGHHTTAVLHLAEHAAHSSRSAPPVVRAYAHAHLAVVQASHDKHAALADMATSERLHEQATTTAPGPFTHYPAGALHYQRAQALNTLGDASGAISALTTSLRLRTPPERHATALTRARLAEILLAQGHLDAALEHWETFLHDCPTLHSALVQRKIQNMRRLLHPHRRHLPTARLLTRAAHH